tara:strand:+ start:46998 stop:47213 length:216 start_codon:yes stop_codon:yes gene_type:complete
MIEAEARLLKTGLSDDEILKIEENRNILINAGYLTYKYDGCINRSKTEFIIFTEPVQYVPFTDLNKITPRE